MFRRVRSLALCLFEESIINIDRIIPLCQFYIATVYIPLTCITEAKDLA